MITAVLMLIAAFCVGVVFLTASMIAAALGYDIACRILSGLGLLLPAILILSAFQ